MKLEYLVFVGAAINFFGSIPYFLDTLKGRTQPNRVSWVLWFTATLIGTIAGIWDGVGLAIVPVFISTITSGLILLASFVDKNAYWELKSFDYLCGLFSVLALVGWGITKEPIVAILFAVLSDGFASVPTLKKAWTHPQSETGSVYVVSFLSGLSGFTAVHAWTLSETAFPFYFMSMNSAIILIIYRHRIFSS